LFGRQDAGAERVIRRNGEEGHRALKPSKITILSWSYSNTGVIRICKPYFLYAQVLEQI
jgi:hypothetical protein